MKTHVGVSNSKPLVNNSRNDPYMGASRSAAVLSFIILDVTRSISNMDWSIAILTFGLKHTFVSHQTATLPLSRLPWKALSA